MTQLLRMRLPFPINLPDSIPNPVPLLTRAGDIADESCAIARHNPGHGPEWYTTRTRLALAYLIAGGCHDHVRGLHTRAHPS